MNVQLKELFDIIGERKTIDYSITADKLSEYGGYSFASPVVVTGEIENRAGVVTLRFKTVFTMDHTCDRCLKEVFKATGTIMWSARTILLIWTN